MTNSEQLRKNYATADPALFIDIIIVDFGAVLGGSIVHRASTKAKQKFPNPASFPIALVSGKMSPAATLSLLLTLLLLNYSSCSSLSRYSVQLASRVTKNPGRHRGQTSLTSERSRSFFDPINGPSDILVNVHNDDNNVSGGRNTRRRKRNSIAQKEASDGNGLSTIDVSTGETSTNSMTNSIAAFAASGGKKDTKSKLQKYLTLPPAIAYTRPLVFFEGETKERRA